MDQNNKMFGGHRIICNFLAVFLASLMTRHISAVTATASIAMTTIPTETNEVDNKPIVAAGGVGLLRALVAPLTSSGVAIELEELLPETIENGTSNHMTILQGETVLLPCKAYSLGQRTVSWIRRRDWHIMSSGSHVYTADNRFSVLNRPGSPDWILMLKSPQLHDSGTYECQIPSVKALETAKEGRIKLEPLTPVPTGRILVYDIAGGQGQVSHFVELLVWAPVASIVEGGEHHVEAESNIQLHCKLHPEANNLKNNKSNGDDTNAGSGVGQQQTKFPHLTLSTVVGGGVPFLWFHNGRPLVHGSKSSAGFGLVSVYLEGVPESDAGRRDWMAWTSRLVIQRADPADSGNYTCAPWRGKAASVNVFVSQGDRPAAVQRQSALKSSIPLNVLIFGLNFLLLQMPLQNR